MATSVTQKPSGQVEIGFLGGTFTGYIRENESKESTADLEYIQDEDANDAIAVVSNPGVRFTVDGVVKAGTTLPAKGDVVTYGSASYLVESVSARSTNKVRRFSMTLYKPDNTTWGSSGSNT